MRQALQQRADALAEQGLVRRCGQRSIVAETGLSHRSVGDGERVSAF
jgi:hypothetical protein